MNISVQIFVWTYVFDSLGYIPRSGIARSHSKFYILTFWVAVRLFSKVTGLKSWRGEAIWPDGLNFYFIKNFILHVIFFHLLKKDFIQTLPALNWILYSVIKQWLSSFISYPKAIVLEEIWLKGRHLSFVSVVTCSPFPKQTREPH